MTVPQLQSDSLESRLDGPFLERLFDEHGGSLYLIDLPRFHQTIDLFRGEFERYWPHLGIGYSYKTNYTPLLCRAAHAAGCYAEVVSRFELDLALRLGISGDRILFNGPVKSADDLQTAFQIGATVNVDSLGEVALIESVAGAVDRPIELGVRCNFAIAESHASRFGIDVDSSEFDEVLKRLNRLPGVTVAGIHCHFSHFRDAASYRRRAERMAQLARDRFDNPLRFVDIGGGFSGRMHPSLVEQFSARPATVREYAESVAPVMAETFANLPDSDRPELVIEPGMGLLADSTRFACQVVTVKGGINGQQIAITTGSVHNIKPTLHSMNLPMQVFSAKKAKTPRMGTEGPVQVTGYTCMEIDVLYRDFSGSLAPGDTLLFENCGAYTNVLTPPFIRLAPAILAWDGYGIQVARRAQRLEDALAGYNLEPLAVERSANATPSVQTLSDRG